MKLLRWAIACIFLAGTIAAQSDLQKLVDTEHSFAKLAAEKGTRTAFLDNLADDGLVFNPEKTNGKAFWTARGESKALLSWAPNYADISANGSLGYTTGNWEWRAKGKDDAPTAFGEFITIWKRQADGKYRFLVDVGVGHDKPEKYSTDWITATQRPDRNTRKLSADNAVGQFAAIASGKGSSAAYQSFAADNIRLYREGKLPFVGKIAAMEQIVSEEGDLKYGDGGDISTVGDLAYFVKGYTLKKADGSVESGNAVQIWKFHGGKWKIVLDILKPVPAK